MILHKSYKSFHFITTLLLCLVPKTNKSWCDRTLFELKVFLFFLSHATTGKLSNSCMHTSHTQTLRCVLMVLLYAPYFVYRNDTLSVRNHNRQNQPTVDTAEISYWNEVSRELSFYNYSFFTYGSLSLELPIPNHNSERESTITPYIKIRKLLVSFSVFSEKTYILCTTWYPPDWEQ